MSHENRQRLQDEMRNHVGYRSPSPPRPASPPVPSSPHQEHPAPNSHQGIPTEPRNHRQNGSNQANSRRQPSGGSSLKSTRYHPYERAASGRNGNNLPGNHAASSSHGDHQFSNDRHSRQQVNAHASSSRHQLPGSSNSHNSAPRFGTSGQPPRGPRKSRGNTQRRAGDRRSLQSRGFNT
ncbi:hypothetical protein CPB84DRAFT_1771182, partial [Gymnopilus junonius]